MMDNKMHTAAHYLSKGAATGEAPVTYESNASSRDQNFLSKSRSAHELHSNKKHTPTTRANYDIPVSFDLPESSQQTEVEVRIFDSS